MTNALFPDHTMTTLCILNVFIFISTFSLIIWEKIPRSYLSILGAVLVIIFGVFDIQEAIDFVNWETIAFLWGAFLLIEILIEAGFFNWVALRVAQRLNYQPLKIFIFFPVLGFFLSAVTNSITVMVFLPIVTLELSRLLRFDPVPVIITEVLLANIGGAATLVGDPPNVILGTMLGFDFEDFLIHNAPIAWLAGLSALAVSYVLQRKNFVSRGSLGDTQRLADQLKSSAGIKDPYLLKLGLAGLGVMLCLLVGNPILNKWNFSVSIAMASMLPAFVILTFGGRRVHHHHFMRRVDSETLIFFIGLFILIGALEKRYIIQAVAQSLISFFQTLFLFLNSVFWGSASISAFVDNVPWAMALGSLIKQGMVDHLGVGLLVWTVSLGCNLGGNLTPIGASANVVAYSYLQKQKVNIHWGIWLKTAFFPSVAAMIVSYLGLSVKYFFNFY